MGQLVVEVRGEEQGSRSSPKWKQHCQDLVEHKRCQRMRRRVLRSGQRAEDCESRCGWAGSVEQTPAKSSTEEEEQVESIVMDSAQTKEDSELNETRIIQMLRERSSDETERIIQGSANWGKGNLGVSDEIKEGITKMLERLHQNALQKREAVQEEVDGHDELDETHGKGSGKGNGGKGEHEGTGRYRGGGKETRCERAMKGEEDEDQREERSEEERAQRRGDQQQQDVEDGDQQECWRTVREENQRGDDDGREDGIAKFERDVWQLEERKRAQGKHIEMRLGQCQDSRGRRSEEVMWRQTWGPVSHIPRHVGSRGRGREELGGAARGKQWRARGEKAQRGARRGGENARRGRRRSKSAGQARGRRKE